MKRISIFKRLLILVLVFILSINSFAAVVADNDGSAFITKAEFDSLKNAFQSQIDQYNISIDSKIEGAIAQYLAGVVNAQKEDVKFLVSNSESVKFVDNFRFKQRKAKRSGDASTGIGAGWTWVNNGGYVVDYYGSESNYPWGQTTYYNWTNNKDCREGRGTKWDFMSDTHLCLWNQQVYMAEIGNSGYTGAAHLTTVDLEATEDKWDMGTNKIYKNLVAIGKLDGSLFYPTNAYPGISCRIWTGGLLYDCPPVFHTNMNFGISWHGDIAGWTNIIKPQTIAGYAIALQSDHQYSTTQRRQWDYRWGKDNYRLYQSAVNVDNVTDKSLDCTWEQGIEGETLSNLMCINNKTLYVSCVEGTTAPIHRKYSGANIIEFNDAWWSHSYQPSATPDYKFGSTTVDSHKYHISNVRFAHEGDTTIWVANLSWDSTTQFDISCPAPLVNCKIKDLGSTILRDNDGLTVKIGDGLPVCQFQKNGVLELEFKVTSSDSRKVKISFKYNGFQDAGDYLKDDTNTVWQNKEVTSGTIYKVKFPIEKKDTPIYCGVINGDNSGAVYSKVSLISGSYITES